MVKAILSGILWFVCPPVALALLVLSVFSIPKRHGEVSRRAQRVRTGADIASRASCSPPDPDQDWTKISAYCLTEVG